MDIRKWTFIIAVCIGTLIVGFIILVSFWNDNIQLNLGGILLLIVIVVIILRWYFLTLKEDK